MKLLKEIQEKNLCRSLKQLAVSGEDLLALGYPEGKAVGETLRWLLQAVLEETLPNVRESLLDQARKRQNRDTKSIK